MKEVEDIKEGVFVKWFCDVDKVERSGVVQSIDKIIFACDVDEDFQLPELDADFSTFGSEPLRYDATVRTADGREFAIATQKLTIIMFQCENEEVEAL